jgi:hypothetical protein
MYVCCSYNESKYLSILKIVINYCLDIWIWNLIFDSKNCDFHCLKHYWNLKFEYENFYLNSKGLFDLKFDIEFLLFSNPKISFSIQTFTNWL